jgi:hypothetical protein
LHRCVCQSVIVITLDVFSFLINACEMFVP